MNAGFEDCTVLNQLIESGGDNWERILEQYQTLRKPAGDAIAALAMRNFVEMRDLTGDPKFLLQKKIEGKFFTKYPERWMPLYSMVTFSHIPYHDAWNEGNRQDKIMAEIMSLPNIESIWDSDAVEQEWLRLTQLNS
jgi:kynurenine 3-monooxygenase